MQGVLLTEHQALSAIFFNTNFKNGLILCFCVRLHKSICMSIMKMCSYLIGRLPSTL